MTEDNNHFKGAFLAVWRGTHNLLWIEHMYHLYRHSRMMEWSPRSIEEWTKERSAFIERSVKIEIDNAVYYVDFRFDCSIVLQRAIIDHYHKKYTRKVKFDD